MKDLFTGDKEENRIVRGVALLADSTRLAELAGRIGFETVWLDVEHGSVPDYSRVEALCTAAEAGGAVPTVRVSDSERSHILRALEIGARVVVVPMVNTRAEAESVVEYGKFPPLGLRGYNTRSRGMYFGFNNKNAQEGFLESNRQTHLFVQIETLEAVRNAEEICEVEGLSGVFIGPGDLSASMGRPGDVSHPDVIAAATKCIRTARAVGKHAGILAFPGPLLEAALEAGCDFAICGGDINEVGNAWEKLLVAIPTIYNFS